MSPVVVNPFQLPSGTQLLPHQVAGHVCQVGKDTISILHDQRQPGTVLKAANKPVCGEREIQFYRRVYSDANDAKSIANTNADIDRCWSPLRSLTPHFFGTVRMPVAQRDVEFMRLQDLTHGMRRPCVMDVKIGARTWDPLATASKITAESEKYAACKELLGFCIPGFQVYERPQGDGDALNVQRFGKDFGKSLTLRLEVRSVLLDFLNASDSADGEQVPLQLLLEILDGVAAIRHWAITQNDLRLYSSSILLAYDASGLPAFDVNGATQHSEEERPPLRTQVKMIDFAHAFDVAQCTDTVADTYDVNYMDGVSTLYEIFAELLPKGVRHGPKVTIEP